jgi:uncharacterized protein YecE (DUF72 family)
MIWIGTSGWVYPHWTERFYPANLPVREQLSYYAHYLPTVEINRSFYRLPTYEQFSTWAEQTTQQPGFRFAVKASRYITHMRKLQNTEEGIARLLNAARGLGAGYAGPFLYQLPPRWHANPQRLEQFIAQLPGDQLVAFEFRDPTWFQPGIVQEMQRILSDAGCALVVAIGDGLPTPLDLPSIGPFGYVRFHGGAHGTGLSEEELGFWAGRLIREASEGREIYVYFNNDPDAHAIRNALRLRELLGSLAAAPN